MISRRLLFSALFVVATALCLALFAVVGQAANEEKGVLASLISKALSTPATRVSIGAIDGALSSDAVIRDIQISDRDGVWFKLDRARIVWRRVALLSRRLEIDRLELGKIEISRKPVPAEKPVVGEAQPLLPALPVKVQIKSFTLEQLSIGKPILGTAAHVAASGSAQLGAPAEGLDLRFDAHRLDQPGALTVRLGFVPNGQRLNLTLALDEPQGGILARAANLTGLPPVKLDLRGDGTLDAFQAKLAFDAGPEVGATGTASLGREGKGRLLTLDVASRIAGMLPEVVAPIFAGTTRLSGKAVYGDDGAVSIPSIVLEAAAAHVDVSGTVGVGGVADLNVAAANVPNNKTQTSLADATIRRLSFNGRITGALAAPRIAATLAAEDVLGPAGRLARINAKFTADPFSSGDGTTHVRLIADAQASGVAPSDAALAEAIGGEVALNLRGDATMSGAANLERLEVKTPTLDANYAGRLGWSELQGQLGVEAPNLALFSAVAGRSLRGAATLRAKIEGTPRAHRLNAQLDGRATNFATGVAPVDRMIGGPLALTGMVHVTPTGDYGFEAVRLNGTNASAIINGVVGQNSSDLKAEVNVPDLRAVDSRVSGQATATALLTGGLRNPAASAHIAITNAMALGKPVPRLALNATMRGLAGALDADVSLDGEIDQKPARGLLHLARPVGGGTVLDGLDVTIGSVVAKGALTLDARNLAAGRLSVDARNLDDLSPLLLARLSGALKADVALDVVDGGQNVRVKARGEKLTAYGVSMGKLDADIGATDAYRRPIVSGAASIDEALVGKERISRVRLKAQGSPDASDITLTAAARGFGLDAVARVTPGDRTRIDIQRFDAKRGQQRIALAGPATLFIANGGVEITRAALVLGKGRLTINGLVGSRLDLNVQAHAIPLSTLETLAPGLGVTGTLDGLVHVAGSSASPTGDYNVRITRLVARQTLRADLPPINVTASGKFLRERVSVVGAVSAGRVGTLSVTGSVPLRSQGSLDVSLRGDLDATAATNGFLAAAGRRATGRIGLDARVSGSIASPQTNGAATLTDGSFSDAANGIELDSIQARIVAHGKELTIVNAAASTKHGGSISATGNVRLDPAGGFPAQIRITGQRAQLVQNPRVTAVANLELGLSGPLVRDPRISGRIDVVSIDVTVPERLSPTLAPLPGTRHVRPTPIARARLALEAAPGGRLGGRTPPPFNATLDLTLSAPGRIAVHGRGVDATLGGSLRLTGTLAKPIPVGSFELTRGQLRILASTLDFSRGRLAFGGDLTPELDFLAETNAGGASIQIAISGPASDPAFAFTSTPALPQDEVLSRLLFGAPSGQLSAGQALTLAQAAATYSGRGSDSFETLRRSLGLSGLDLNLGASGGPGIGLTRAINDRARIVVKAGATPQETGVGVDFDVTKHFRVKSGVTSDGGASAGIATEFQW